MPLPDRKSVKKMEKGSPMFVYKNDQICTVWRVNEAVYVANNIHNVSEKSEDGSDENQQGKEKGTARKTVNKCT